MTTWLEGEELTTTQNEQLEEILSRMNIHINDCEEHDTVAVFSDWSTVRNDRATTYVYDEDEDGNEIETDMIESTMRTSLVQVFAHDKDGNLPLDWIKVLYDIIQKGEPKKKGDDISGDFVQYRPGGPYVLKVYGMSHCESEDDEDECEGCCYCVLSEDERPTPPWEEDEEES